jgi:hypothetical protein
MDKIAGNAVAEKNALRPGIIVLSCTPVDRRAFQGLLVVAETFALSNGILRKNNQSGCDKMTAYDLIFVDVLGLLMVSAYE